MANTTEQDHDLTKQALQETGALIATLTKLIASDNLLLGSHALVGRDYQDPWSA